MRAKDLTGGVFGRLTVTRFAGREQATRSYRLWECRCVCGTVCTVRAGHLLSGGTKSCGCHNPGNRTHGKSRTPEHSVWCGMRKRCTNPNEANFKHYGGRGISVDPAWDSFEQFLSDMGPRPTPKHSIERVDVNGDYTSSNCVWATQTTQTRNSRRQRNNTSGVRGVGFNKKLSKWTAQISLNKQPMHLGVFTTKEEAVKARQKAEEKHWAFA